MRRKNRGFLMFAIWPAPLAILVLSGLSGLGSPTTEAAPREAVMLRVEYAGPETLVKAMIEGRTQPTALASGDFDEDGMPDLVSAQAGSGFGFVAVHRGNVDTLFPHSPGARSKVS